MNAKGLKQKSKVKCCKLTAFPLTSSLPEEDSLQKKKVVLALNLGFGRVTDRKADLQHFGVLGFFVVFFFSLNHFLSSTVFLPFTALDRFTTSSEGFFYETFGQL